MIKKLLAGLMMVCLACTTPPSTVKNDTTSVKTPAVITTKVPVVVENRTSRPTVIHDTVFVPKLIHDTLWCVKTVTTATTLNTVTTIKWLCSSVKPVDSTIVVPPVDTTTPPPPPPVDTIPVPLPTTSKGKPYGPMSLGPANFGTFTGSMMVGEYKLEQTKARVDSVHARNGHYFLGLTNRRPFFIDSVKHIMSVKKWTDWFDKTWLPVTSQVQYGFVNQTLLGIYLMDEPRWANTWSVPTGWKGWTQAQVDSVACHVELRWPFTKGLVAVRQEPSWWSSRPKCVGITWGQLAPGPTITVANLKAFSDKIAADAAKISTCYVEGFNRLNGGHDGPIGSGTDPTNSTWRQATAKEYALADSFLVTYVAPDGSRPYAVIGWQYSPPIQYPANDPARRLLVQAFDTLSAIKAISVKVAAIAAKQPYIACKRTN